MTKTPHETTLHRDGPIRAKQELAMALETAECCVRVVESVDVLEKNTSVLRQSICFVAREARVEGRRCNI